VLSHQWIILYARFRYILLSVKTDP
jgi:hypothetical protein